MNRVEKNWLNYNQQQQQLNLHSYRQQQLRQKNIFQSSSSPNFSSSQQRPPPPSTLPLLLSVKDQKNIKNSNSFQHPSSLDKHQKYANQILLLSQSFKTRIKQSRDQFNDNKTLITQAQIDQRQQLLKKLNVTSPKMKDLEMIYKLLKEDVNYSYSTRGANIIESNIINNPLMANYNLLYVKLNLILKKT
jgi:hypothetical protein